MDKTTSTAPLRAPWHLWIIALLLFFIYANGVYDYFMMLSLNDSYYASKHYGEEVKLYFAHYPLFPLILYTLNIFSGVIAPILLLLRSRWATPIALLSVISISGLECITFTWMNRWNILGTMISLFDIGILLITVGMYLYCRFLSQRRLLK